MDLKKQFGYDKRLATSGKWARVGRDSQDRVSRLKIARIPNPNYTEDFRTRSRPFIDAMRAGILDEDTKTQLFCESLAATVLLDWENIEDDGEVVEYSFDSAVGLMLKYEGFRDLVVSIAKESSHFKEDSTGN